KTPTDIDPLVWRSFMGDYRIHGNFEMGEIEGKRLLELDPGHEARYVLLFNMFSNANR
ncbi:hypothetical protein MKW92_033328, partial [Papaver armeniacum]